MADVGSLFAKKKAKAKAKKSFKSINLNKDPLRPATTGPSQSLGLSSSEPSNEPKVNSGVGDDGWAEKVEKRVVANTSGKEVAEFVNMDELRTVDEDIAERIYMEDLKKDFQSSREKTENAPEEEPQEPVKEEPKATGALVGGWRERMKKKEEERRVVQLDTGNAQAFPSLGVATKAAEPRGGSPPRTQGAGSAQTSVWSKKPLAVVQDKVEDGDAEAEGEAGGVEDAGVKGEGEAAAADADGVVESDGVGAKAAEAADVAAEPAAREEVGPPAAPSAAEVTAVSEPPVAAAAAEASPAAAVSQAAEGDEPDLASMFKKKKKKKKPAT